MDLFSLFLLCLIPFIFTKSLPFLSTNVPICWLTTTELNWKLMKFFIIFLHVYNSRLKIIDNSKENLDQKSIIEIDQNNPAFNIHHIPSSISLDTPSERSTSAESQDQKLSNSTSLLPNGNLPTMLLINNNNNINLSNNNNIDSPFPSTPSSPVVLTITNDCDEQQQQQQQRQQQQSSRKLSKLTIMEPIDSICWYTFTIFLC